MPEGPELHLSSKFVNRVCDGRVFGRVFRSEVSKSLPVIPPAAKFTISSTSRGKEIKLTLRGFDAGGAEKKNKPGEESKLDVLFAFGMSGKFEFYEATELKKHAHMNFFTDDGGPPMVLSFNDYRRFGKWVPGADFSYKDRSPCVLTEYSLFRENVLKNIESSVFEKPICEVLLNQRYFNGIGNYLRAEILYRAKIPPFVSARSVLEPLVELSSVKSESHDILELCNILPLEVVQLEGSWYDSGDKQSSGNLFNDWLQCYYQEGMKNVVDHNKRTVWYSGPLGPLAPKGGVSRGKNKSKPRSQKGTEAGKSRKRVKKEETVKEETDEAFEEIPAKKQRTTQDNGGKTENDRKGRVTRNRVKEEESKKEERQVAKARTKSKIAEKAKVGKTKAKRTRKSNKDVKELETDMVASIEGDEEAHDRESMCQTKAHTKTKSRTPLKNGVSCSDGDRPGPKRRLSTPKQSRHSRKR